MEHSFEMGDEYDGDDSSSEDCSVDFEQGIESIDAIKWPEPIKIMPVSTAGLEAQAKKMLERIGEPS